MNEHGVAQPSRLWTEGADGERASETAPVSPSVHIKANEAILGKHIDETVRSFHPSHSVCDTGLSRRLWMDSGVQGRSRR